MRYPKTLTYDQHNELESEVSNVEIKRAVWDCGTDKSPGPDGFTFGFYRRFWKIIENDVYDAVKYFFTYGNIPKGCNSSFIALIPKIPDANMVKDFRPISLIGSLYKIIAKILANRLVGVLGDIVNEVDFEKAYDSVRWDFLDDILKKFGFGEKWCKWIQSCLRSSRAKLSLEYFTHLFYADDAVFMGQWCDGNISTLIHVLECFYRASGLRINMSKSKILGVNVDSDKVKGAASKLGCLILKTPFTYLGSKVGGSMSRVHAWNEAIHGDDGNVGGHVKSGAKSCWLDIIRETHALKTKVEQDQFNELSALVHDVSLIPMSDRWKWDLESREIFLLRSVLEDFLIDTIASDVDSENSWIKICADKGECSCLEG
ncbi:hypothetical protein Tco_0563485 [Tanacetum coccineum]